MFSTITGRPLLNRFGLINRWVYHNRREAHYNSDRLPPVLK